MGTRRHFLALVGGSAFTGAALQSPSAARATLILPRAAALSSARPLLDAHRCQMDAYLEVARHAPHDMFLDWIESGLQLAQRHRRAPADLQREEDRIEAAVFKHGSIIAAMRAGAL